MPSTYYMYEKVYILGWRPHLLRVYQHNIPYIPTHISICINIESTEPSFLNVSPGPGSLGDGHGQVAQIPVSHSAVKLIAP
jgi:hypothetical protein